MALRPAGASGYKIRDMRVPTQTPWKSFSERSKRWLLPLGLAVLALVQAGCGSETESQEPRQGLSNTQFREIERLYRVQVEAEKMEDKGRDRQALQKTAKACAAVDDSDPLLAAMVNGCGELARFALSLASSKCDTPSGCARQLGVAATRMDDLVDTLRQNERTIDRLLGENGCSETLDAPREFFVVFHTASRALRDMAAAIESGDDVLVDEAVNGLERAEKDLESLPSAATFLERFREACA